MAIIKEVKSSYGCSAKYHKVLAISINYQIKKIIICVASFIDKEARANNYEPLDMVDVEVPTEDYPHFLTKPAIEAAYSWLKTNAVGFEDAEDDLDSFVENKEEIKNDTNEY